MDSLGIFVVFTNQHDDHWYILYPAAILNFPSISLQTTIQQINKLENLTSSTISKCQMLRQCKYILLLDVFLYIYSFISKNIINANTLPFIKQFNIECQLSVQQKHPIFSSSTLRRTHINTMVTSV